ncbi:pantetheine-phosphate adenylyltransferase [Sphingomonas sp. MMS24-J13]|uniref:pantetheine-phosphate adenylyltransferase n=1 Tax=Sphingomonas sp. MMS24-J13 TaxID=3238686 RepID=UPI00384B1453
MKRVAVYTGTFDPLTLGHLDIIRRAIALVDKLVIGLPTQSSKSPLFSPEERLAVVRREVAALPGEIEVRQFDGLAVSFASSVGAHIIVRGLRSGADFDYEDQMAAMNATMAPDIETIFLVAAPGLRSIASSLVKEVARGHGVVEHFVPPAVAADIYARLR